MLEKTSTLKAAKIYLGDADPCSPLASPLYADPAGLPPLLIQVGSEAVLLSDSTLFAEKARAASLPKVKMTSRETGDLIMMGIGGFTPLEGFMTHADWQGVCDGYKMANGLFWPIPVTLSTDEVTAQGISVGADGGRGAGRA